jgi:hypothetical protein
MGEKEVKGVDMAAKKAVMAVSMEREREGRG